MSIGQGRQVSMSRPRPAAAMRRIGTVFSNDADLTVHGKPVGVILGAIGFLGILLLFLGKLRRSRSS